MRKKKRVSIFWKAFVGMLGIAIFSNLILASSLYDGYKGILSQIKPYLDPDLFHGIEVNISNTWLIFFATMMFIIPLVVLFVVVFSSKIIAPLETLLKAVKEISAGNLLVRARVKTNDEVEELAESFNKMAEAIEAAQENLQDINRVLEIRVRARTRQLEEQRNALIKENELKTRQLRERLEELEKFHRLTVGRELKMIELKKEIQRLKETIQKQSLSKKRF